MSIATKTGDSGTTSLKYQRRVSKCHPQIEACGALDELNSAIGLARAAAANEAARQHLPLIQQHLAVIMGELATMTEDMPRHEQEGLARVTPALTAHLDQLLQDLETNEVATHGWAMPGANPSAAALDLARAICRRAERRVCALFEASLAQNREILVYLNRLSDALWLLARRSEQVGTGNTPDKP
jgi:cob(I)alamin adenosyltransferase